MHLYTYTIHTRARTRVCTHAHARAHTEKKNVVKTENDINSEAEAGGQKIEALKKQVARFHLLD